MQRRPPLRINALTLAVMTRALLDGPCTVYDLHEACGLGVKAIRPYIRALKSQKVIHIAQWDQDSLGRFNFAAYKLGEGKDVAKPKPDRLRARRTRAAREAHRVLIQMTAGSIANAEA